VPWRIGNGKKWLERRRRSRKHRATAEQQWVNSNNYFVIIYYSVTDLDLKIDTIDSSLRSKGANRFITVDKMPLDSYKQIFN